MDHTIERLIHASNPQWKGKWPFEEFCDREVQIKLFEILDNKQIICLLGPRRSGKTTLLKILISRLLSSGTGPRQIFYLTFDELMASDHKIMEEILQYYYDNIAGEGRSYIFLDEVHNIDYWQTVLKRHYDGLHPNTKFFITGSSSAWLKRRSRESLAGRSYDVMVWPLSFREYLGFRHVQVPGPVRPRTFQDLESYWEGLGSARDTVVRELNRFVLFGGFPEMALGDATLEELRQYLWTYVMEKTVLRDLAQYFPVDNPKTLVEVLGVLAGQSSSLLSVTNLAETLGTKPATMSKYLSYLELGYLIGFSYNYTKSKVKQVRSSKKAYLTDTGLITALSHLEEDLFSHPKEAGLLVETSVRNHFSRLTECYFWRDEHKNEVDLLARYRKALLPIEVKFSDGITSGDLDTLRLFLRKHKVSRGIVTTKAQLKDLGDIWAVPVPLLLLMDWKDWGEGRGKD